MALMISKIVSVSSTMKWCSKALTNTSRPSGRLVMIGLKSLSPWRLSSRNANSCMTRCLPRDCADMVVDANTRPATIELTADATDMPSATLVLSRAMIAARTNSYIFVSRVDICE